MIEFPFRARLVAAVGRPSLTLAGIVTARTAAIPLTAVAMRADPEHDVASLAAANSLPENNLALNVHPRRQAGLDNDDRSWQVGTSFDVW